MNKCSDCKKSVWCQLENKDNKCLVFEACLRVKQVSMFKELQYK